MNENHALAVIAVNITTWFEIVAVAVCAMVLFFDEESATFTRRALPYLIDEFTYLEPLTYLVLLSLCHSSYQLEEEHHHRMPLGSHISDTDKRSLSLQLPASRTAALVATLASATLGDVLLARCSGSCRRVNLLPTHLVRELAAASPSPRRPNPLSIGCLTGIVSPPYILMLLSFRGRSVR